MTGDARHDYREPETAPFDRVAHLYATARRGHPDVAFDRLLDGVPRGAHVLEIGCGAGQATLPMLRRGMCITAVELGAALAAEARRRCADFDDFTVEVAAFETWDACGASFDAVACVQAFHWIDPAEGLAKISDLLPPGGLVALLWSTDRSEGTPFYEATRPVYDAAFAANEKAISLWDRVVACERVLRAHPAFADITEWDHDWFDAYTPDEYVAHLGTDSRVLTLGEEAQREFLDRIGDIAHALGGVTRTKSLRLLRARRV